MGGERVRKDHLDGQSCINDDYLQEAVNIIQAKAQTVHEALHAAKEHQKLSEQVHTVQITPSDVCDHL